VTNGGVDVTLEAVTNFGPNSVWAAGNDKQGPMIAEWNGATIVRYSLPGTLRQHQRMELITGSSSSDIWAGGTYISPAGVTVFLYHYDGSTWKIAPVPSAAESAAGILALSPTEVLLLASTRRGADIFRWNGFTWSVLQRKAPVQGGDTGATTLVGTSDHDLYAVSTSGTGIEHWNGTSWAPFADFGGEDFIYSLDDDSASAVWSAGQETAPNNSVFIAANSTRQTNPPDVVEQPGGAPDITSAYGVVLAVGPGTIPTSPGGPLLLRSCY
jgi:hypothetical protein